MRIECPACAAVYDLPERLLSAGSRILRCAACGKTWTVNPSAPAEPATAEAAPAAGQAPAARSGDGEFAALMQAVVSANKDGAPEDEATLVVAEDGDRPHDHAEEPADAGGTTAEAGEEPGVPPAAVAIRPSAAPVRPSFGLVMAWLATLGGLGAIILAFAWYPQDVVAHWPAAARLYEAVGITFDAS